MIVYDVHPQNPQSRFINDVVSKMKRGALSIYPTDLNYGVGASLGSRMAVKNLNKLAEHQNRTKLHSIIFSNFSDISHFAYISNSQFKILKKYLPGSYTFILEAKNTVPKLSLTKRKTIGVRLLDTPVTNYLIDELSSPLLNISAIHGEELIEEDPIYIQSIYKAYPYVESFISIGTIDTSSKTRVVDLTDEDELRILR